MTKTKIMMSSPPMSLDKQDDQLRLLKDIRMDHNNNEGNHNATASKKHNRHFASILFKYQTNACSRDIDSLRELVTQERGNQLNTIEREEYNFYQADYERILSDEWLATRFLLRGKKAYEREQQSNDSRSVLRLFDGVSEAEQLDGNQEEGQTNAEQQRQSVLKHTLELVKVCARFRFDYRINNRTRVAEFPLEWVKVDGLFHYKPDLVGNPTAYLRVALHRPKLIEAPEARHQFKRYMLYTLERCDQELYNKPGKAICCVFDMTNVAFENIDLELTTWMIKSFKSSSPKLLCYVIVYNPPWFFTATFKVICNTLLSNSKRQSVKFAYGNEILNYIDYTNLPPYLKATIR